MQIVQQLAGYSLGEADNLRRAMSKKKMAVMEENRDVFINGKVGEDGKVIIPGAVRNGVDRQVANTIYDEMISFAKYAFNKSHSAAYSLVAVQTAYLKHYYPEEYMANLISSVMDQSGKLYSYVSETKRLGIEVLAPDINKSYGSFKVADKKIIFGLSGIKNVGLNLIDSIVKARDEGGAFTNFKNFLERVEDYDPRALNKKGIESLIKAGAFDSLGYTRSSLMAIFEKAINTVHDNNKINVTGQINLLDMASAKEDTDIDMPNIDEYPKKVKLKLEKEVLGFYISEHPLSERSLALSNIVNFTTNYREELGENRLASLDGKFVTMAGIINNKKELTTKKRDLMAFASLEDMYGNIEMVIFPKTYSEYRKLIDDDNVVIVKGRLQTDESDVKLLASEFIDLDNANLKTLYLKIEYREYNNIKGLLMENLGKNPVKIYFEDKKKLVGLDSRLWFNINDQTIKLLEDRLGKENVKVK